MVRLKEIAEKWNALKNDNDRWQYVLEHKNEIALRLDNDYTFPVFCETLIPDNAEDWDDLPKLDGFKWWIGNNPGISYLMEALGVEAAGV